ncbi:hypothetical protein [Bosea sp. (in: a-proteobacteria)]|uniref:hypothetical protein n=1 Tax=Bosea sp. (in: a-proteobacteria) TaxID=1871050 RepID=UPI002733AA8C|nr:hypothetical protein [Bosea sp. (in: a-proteobacteria)]MDP3407148.1 hypothetical protein [Bosea sp. (in: a-proteobacteria)]
MTNSSYRVFGTLLCSLLAALSLYCASRLDWLAIPLALFAILSAISVGRYAAFALIIVAAFVLVGYFSNAFYFIDFAASQVRGLDAAKLAGSHSMKGRYILNSGFLDVSRHIAVIEGDAADLDAFQRQSSLYLTDLSRGACRNTIVRVTQRATVVDSSCQDGAERKN